MLKLDLIITAVYRVTCGRVRLLGGVERVAVDVAVVLLPAVEEGEDGVEEEEEHQREDDAFLNTNGDAGGADQRGGVRGVPSSREEGGGVHQVGRLHRAAGAVHHRAVRPAGLDWTGCTGDLRCCHRLPAHCLPHTTSSPRPGPGLQQLGGFAVFCIGIKLISQTHL